MTTFTILGKRTDLPLAAELGGRGRLRVRAAHPARQWYRIAAKADTPDTTTVDIYDEIGWFGTTADQFLEELRAISTPNIELHLNSPGGDVFDGVAIYNSLRQHDAAVHVVVDSLAASAASVIAMAGDRVTAMGGSMLMIHDPWGMVIGNAIDLRDMADLLDKHADNLAGIYAAHAGGDVAGWRAAMAAETWYTAQEALDAGLVDDIDQGQGRPVSDRWDLTVFSHAPQPPTNPPPPANPQDTASPTHHTDTTDAGSWDAGANQRRLPSPMSVAIAKRAYGYYDSARVSDGEIVKDACKLLHHEVSADGDPGAAHLGGVRNALSRLPQSDIPESEHAAIQRHLNAHLEDAPQQNTSTTSSVSADTGGARRDYLGEPDSWYLPTPPETKEMQGCL